MATPVPRTESSVHNLETNSSTARGDNLRVPTEIRSVQGGINSLLSG